MPHGLQMKGISKVLVDRSGAFNSGGMKLGVKYGIDAIAPAPPHLTFAHQ